MLFLFLAAKTARTPRSSPEIRRHVLLEVRLKLTIFNGWTKWKSGKFSFSRNARLHGSRHQAAPWRQRSRTAQARNDRMTRQRAEDQQLYNRPTLTSWAYRGSLSKRRELVLSSLPTHPACFCWFSAPRSLTLRASFPCICSPPVCIIRSVTSPSLATTTWTPEHPFFSTHCCPNTSSNITCVLGGGLFPVTTHGFSSRGVAAVMARRLFPSTISGERGSGSKIRLTAGFELCPQGPSPSSFSCSTLSLLMCTLFCAFNTCVSCITLFLGLAASHSSKDPPSLAYWLFASPQLNSVRWCCRGRAKRENPRFSTQFSHIARCVQKDLWSSFWWDEFEVEFRLACVYLKASPKLLKCLFSLSALLVALRLFNVLVSLSQGTLKEDHTRSVGPSPNKIANKWQQQCY